MNVSPCIALLWVIGALCCCTADEAKFPVRHPGQAVGRIQVSEALHPNAAPAGTERKTSSRVPSLPNAAWTSSLPDSLWQPRPQLSLKLFFYSGWGTSYTLEINFDTGEIIYAPANADKPQHHQLKDFKNVGVRVKSLIERTPKSFPRSFGDDVPRYLITFHNGKMVKQLTLGHLGPPDEELCTLLDTIVADLNHRK